MHLFYKSKNSGVVKYFTFGALHFQELLELKGQIKDTSVVVEMDNSRKLDMDAIVSEVRAQYEEIASRTRSETETWYKQKVRDFGHWEN